MRVPHSWHSWPSVTHRCGTSGLQAAALCRVVSGCGTSGAKQIVLPRAATPSAAASTDSPVDATRSLTSSTPEAAVTSRASAKKGRPWRGAALDLPRRPWWPRPDKSSAPVVHQPRNRPQPGPSRRGVRVPRNQRQGPRPAAHPPRGTPSTTAMPSAPAGSITVTEAESGKHVGL